MLCLGFLLEGKSDFFSFELNMTEPSVSGGFNPPLPPAPENYAAIAKIEVGVLTI